MVKLKIGRKSKYKHVYGEEFIKKDCFENLKPNPNAWDADYVKVNSDYIAIPTAGNNLTILSHSMTGKNHLQTFPKINLHPANILDFDFSPFNNNVIATGDHTGSAKIWNIPKDLKFDYLKKPTVTLNGHSKKIGIVKFHPTSSNVLTTYSIDKTIKLWDIEKAEKKLDIKLDVKGFIQSLSYNKIGDQFATTCKDSFIRLFDPRAEKQTDKFNGFKGKKGSRVCWLTNVDKIFAVGFGQMMERIFKIFDPRKTSEPLTEDEVGESSGILIPHYHPDNNILFLSGKGENQIYYYEVTNKSPSYLSYINTFQGKTPQKGIGFIPKYCCNVEENEIARAYKLTTNSVVPIKFIVPRKSKMFQDDLYPDTPGQTPGQSADDFFAGKNNEVPLIKFSMEMELEQSSEEFTPTATETKVEEKKIEKSEKSDDGKDKIIEKLQKENSELKEKVITLTSKVEDLEKEIKNLKVEEKKEEEKVEEEKVEEEKVEEEKERVEEEEKTEE